jgi:hypothetical protein
MKKVKRIIVIAAPSCCGKSTLIHQLMTGEHAHINKHIKLFNPSTWLYRDITLSGYEREVLQLSKPDQKKLLLHYTIPYPSIKFIFRPGYDKLSRMRILMGSNDIILLTLYVNPKTLLYRVNLRRQRVIERRNQGKVPNYKFLKGMRTLKTLERIYLDTNRIVPMYNKWFKFCKKINTKSHYLVEVETTPKLSPLMRWPEIYSCWHSN